MAARNAARALAPSTAPRLSVPARRLASTTSETVQTVKAQASRNSTALLYSAGGLGAILAGVYYFSGSESDKRKRALAKIDRAKAASQTPSAVAAKASEAKEKSPALDGSASEERDMSQEAAFNPETGEINWDCPCLGGMAHGSCGEEFKAAFSCFVYSEAEPKGVDCIDKFNAMQTCFREHPKEYAQTIKDDEAMDADIEQGGSDSEIEMRNAQAAGRQAGGVGPIDRVKAEAKSLKDKAGNMVERTKEAVAGNPSVVPPKHKQEHNEGKPLKQPKGEEGEHKSKAPSSGGASPGSGYDEAADHHVAGDAGSSGNLQGASAPGAGKHSLHPEKTPNQSKGEKDPLGRNAAEGSKPSGSSKAHEKHKQGVEATRSGEEAENSKSRITMRG